MTPKPVCAEQRKLVLWGLLHKLHRDLYRRCCVLQQSEQRLHQLDSEVLSLKQDNDELGQQLQGEKKAAGRLQAKLEALQADWASLDEQRSQLQEQLSDVKRCAQRYEVYFCHCSSKSSVMA